jgi:hypothetical protein
LKGKIFVLNGFAEFLTGSDKIDGSNEIGGPDKID